MENGRDQSGPAPHAPVSNTGEAPFDNRAVESAACVPYDVAFLNTNLEIVWVNQAAADLVGKSPSELIGRKCRDFFEVLVNTGEECPVTRAAKTGKPESDEVILSDGRMFTLRGEPVFSSGGSLAGILLIGRDITRSKREEELVYQTRRLTSVGELAGGVAHHFNNMLQIVMGNMELALTDFQAGNLSEIGTYLERALESTRHGAEIVRRLQSFARVRPDQYPVDNTIFDLSETVEEAAEITSPWWQGDAEKEAPKVALHLDLMEGCLVRGSEGELFEVAVSLIKNAAEALPNGGEIRVATGIDDDRVYLRVRDTGTGIRRENLSKVFDPFWSAKGPLRAGMGLALSYGIVKRHNGDISVDSMEGKGSTFTVQLPLAAGPMKPPEAPETTVTPRLDILVVDDLKAVVDMIEIVLRRKGHTVYTALSGPDALNLLKERNIDLVICDLDMPGMNGWDLGRELRILSEQRGAAKAPFILMTGWRGQTIELQDIKDSGVDGVLEKPIEISRLDHAIRQAVMNRPSDPSHRLQ